MTTLRDLLGWLAEVGRVLRKFASAPLKTVRLPPEWSWREALGVLCVLSAFSGFLGALVGTGLMLQIVSPYDIDELSRAAQVPVWGHILSFQFNFVLGAVLWAFATAGGVTCGLYAWLQGRNEAEEGVGENGALQHLEYLPLFRQVVVASIPVHLSNLVAMIVPGAGIMAYGAMGFLLYQVIFRKSQPASEATPDTGVSR